MASQMYPGLNLYEKMRESELPRQELASPIKNQQSVSERFLQAYLKKSSQALINVWGALTWFTPEKNTLLSYRFFFFFGNELKYSRKKRNDFIEIACQAFLHIY